MPEASGCTIVLCMCDCTVYCVSESAFITIVQVIIAIVQDSGIEP